MKAFYRRAGVAFLLILVFCTIPLFAQDSGEISVVGSGIVTPLFESLAQASSAASGVSANLSVNVTGTNNGFASLCNGTADVVTANRRISEIEAANCSGLNIQYIELLLAHDVIAFIAPLNTTYAQCLTLNNLNAIFAPSSQGQIVNWNQLYSDNPDLPISIFVPQVDSTGYAILDSLISGTGLRSEAQARAADAEIISAVNATSGAIGVVKYTAALANDPNVNILNLEAGTQPGCVFPSADGIETGQYPAATSLYLYVNINSLSKAGLLDVLNFASGESAPAIVEAAGFIAPSTSAYDANLATLQNPVSEAAADEQLYQIPAGVAGQVRIGGAANATSMLLPFSTSFSTTYATVTFDYNVEGQDAGFRRLCNGEIDIVASNTAMTPEQLQNCQANNIVPVTFDFGYQAVVLLANPNDTYAHCLNTMQIGKIWSAESQGAVTLWNQVDPTFPANVPLTLFAPVSRSFTLPGSPDTYTIYNDLLMHITTGAISPVRADTALKDQERFANNAAYRAQAVGNTAGGLTYLSWSDYQRALENPAVALVGETVEFGEGTPTPQAIYRVQPVSVALVTGGVVTSTNVVSPVEATAEATAEAAAAVTPMPITVGPCVEPTIENITSGQYPLSRPVTLYVNQRSLALPEVKSFLWYSFQTENFPVFESVGIAGITEDALPNYRINLKAQFDAADVAAAEAAEATPEATASPDSTAEATLQPEGESTAQPAPDAEVTSEGS